MRKSYSNIFFYFFAKMNLKSILNDFRVSNEKPEIFGRSADGIWQSPWPPWVPLSLIILTLLLGQCALRFPTLLVYLVQISPFFERFLTQFSPSYIYLFGKPLCLIWSYLTSFLVIWGIISARYNLSLQDLTLTGYRLRNYLVLGSVIGVLKATVITLPFLLIFPKNMISPYYPSEAFRWKPEVFIFTLLLTVIIGPFVEELLFRGMLYSSLRKKINSAGSVLLSSIVFGVLHFQFSGIPTTFSSIITAVIFEMTGSLVLCWSIHAVGNLTIHFYNAYIFYFIYNELWIHLK